jgi:AcrR family transcriptional regulator
MSSQMSTLPRQSLNARQVETVERLFAEAAKLLDEVGHEQLTIRMVAQRTGVSAATAYTYFASKDHLFAELFWRQLEADEGVRLTGRTPVTRLQQLVRHFAEVIGGSPALAAAVNKSLLSGDPEVERLRRAIGTLWVERFQEAIGPDSQVDPEVLMTLAFAVSGALLQAGIGLFTYERLADHLADAVAVIMRGID